MTADFNVIGSLSVFKIQVLNCIIMQNFYHCIPNPVGARVLYACAYWPSFGESSKRESAGCPVFSPSRQLIPLRTGSLFGLDECHVLSG